MCVKFSKSAGVSLVAFFIGLMTARAATHYLMPTNLAAANPYTSWETAGTSVIDVVNAAVSNATTPRIVRVTNGIYILTNTVTITNDVVLQGVNGRDVTIINGDGKYRCFFLKHTNCVLDGLTITNGYSTSGGGGINISGGIVSNCLITTCENSPTTWGNSGGGIYIAGTGIVANSIIRGNIATNSVDGEGGGLSLFSGRAMVENCVIENNAGSYGAGINVRNSSTIRNCLIRNNRLIGGTGVRHGGGINKGSGSTLLINCTIVSNYSASYGGGLSLASDQINTVINCIIYSNKCAAGPVANDIWLATFGDSPSAFSYSCCTATNKYFVIGGTTGNKTNNPGFTDFAGGDYHFKRTSPCFNTGTNQLDWMTNAVDLDGHARILHGRVDMGAYELFIPSGSIFRFR